ncbi:hypothetical protein [Magnetovibrio sp.]|uniref:hypothetical protein n=1 Tax=Magnetovibrio sp. TaxID=2024836 RepID=UPI002F932886
MMSVAQTAAENATHASGAESLSAQTAEPDGYCGRRALVVFGGDADLKWLRFLRPGYRHCFALLESGDRWVMYNPLSNGTEVDVWPGDQEEAIRAWLVSNGYEVMDQIIQPLRPQPYAWAPYSCVEAVKRVLGLRAPGVFTPWQLYRHLEKTKNGKNSLTLRCG